MGKRLHSYNSAGSIGKYLDQRPNIPIIMKQKRKESCNVGTIGTGSNGDTIGTGTFNA